MCGKVWLEVILSPHREWGGAASVASGGRGGERDMADGDSLGIQAPPQGAGGGQRASRAGGGGGDWVAVCAREPQNICGRHAPPIKGAAGRTHSAVEP